MFQRSQHPQVNADAPQGQDLHRPKERCCLPLGMPADGYRSSYVKETSRALGKRVKEHCKSSTSAILKHCTDHHHPLPSLSNFNVIDKDPSQVTWEAKEAIHIRRLDPNLNRNIGKMSIPYCIDRLLGVKPKYSRVDLLSQAQKPVDETAPPSQIPGLNLTQFHNIGTFRPNLINKIPKCSNRACRAKNYSIKLGQLFITWHELSNVIPFISKLSIGVKMCLHTSDLIAQVTSHLS